MFGLDFSLSTSSVERLARIMKKHDVRMFSTSVAILSIWSESTNSSRADRDYKMKDILDDERFLDILTQESHHQLEDFVEAVLKRADELEQQKEHSMKA